MIHSWRNSKYMKRMNIWEKEKDTWMKNEVISKKISNLIYFDK